MKVIFVLPRWSRIPIGGYRVVYQHAAALARTGEDVEVLHLACVDPSPLRGHAAELARRLRSRTGSAADVSWFALPGVRVRSLHRLTTRFPAGTVVVATSWQTARPVAAAAAPGWGCYLLQSLEHWSGPSDEVNATWRLPLHKAAVARWLVSAGRELSPHPIDLVPLSVQLSTGGLTPAPDTFGPRSRTRVTMLWHPHPVKGSDLGLAALRRARAEVPELQATVFSTEARPPEVGPEIEWIRRPDRPALERLLHDTAVFLSPSRTEGWALPPAEAMSCGAALVATDIGGHHDYAEDDVTAVLVPAGDADALGDAIVSLLKDPGRRERLALAGAARIARFTVGASEAAMRAFLTTRPGTGVADGGPAHGSALVARAERTS